MRIAILNADDVPHDLALRFGQYPAMFQALLRRAEPQLQFASYDVHRGRYPPSVDSADGFLITGSKAAAYDQAGWITRLIDYINTLAEHRCRLVGICFGHQLIARALGGRVEKSPRGWGVGVHRSVIFTKPGWMDFAPDRFDLIVSHRDQVTVATPSATVLAGSEFCPIAMTQIDDYILSFQGHPEFSVRYAAAIIRSRADVIDSATASTALASLKTATDAMRVASWIARFFHGVPAVCRARI